MVVYCTTSTCTMIKIDLKLNYVIYYMTKIGDRKKGGKNK